MYVQGLTKSIDHDIGTGFGFYYNCCEYQKKEYKFGDITKVTGYTFWKERFVYVGYVQIKYPDDACHLM